jgi:hypothetical protein
MVENYIVCLGAGSAQIPLIQKAKKLGYKIIGIDQNSDSPGINIVDKKIVISTYEDKAVVNELVRLKNKYNFQYIGVVARASGPALHTAAAISKTFSLPGLTAEIVPLATEKSTFRNFCRESNISVPKGEKLELTNSIETKYNFPVIVKPDLPIVGKEAVKLITDSDKFCQAVQLASDASYNGAVEIEEFIEGFDIGCLFRISGNTSSIIAYWDELVGIKKNGEILGCGVSVPSVIQGTEIENKVKIIVEKFTKSLSSSVEAILILAFRINLKGDPSVIELHADLGGDLIADDLFPISAPHFDYFKLCMHIATKNNHHVPITNFTPSAIIYKNIFRQPKPSERITEVVKSFSVIDLHKKIIDKLNRNKKEFLFMPNHFNIVSQIYS